MNQPKDVTGRINQAELARRLKVSRPSVSKAVKAGRVTPDEDGLFDPEAAEIQWLSNTRPSASRGKPSAGGYASARARKETALARLAELRLDQSIGKLIERSAVDFALDDLGATLRGLMDNFPDRLAPLIHASQSMEEVHSILTQAADEVLRDLSDSMARRAAELDTAASE